MEKEISDMFDLVATLLILCICMATGVSSAIRDDREVIGYEASYKDKTAEVKYTPSLKYMEIMMERLHKGKFFLRCNYRTMVR